LCLHCFFFTVDDSNLSCHWRRFVCGPFSDRFRPVFAHFSLNFFFGLPLVYISLALFFFGPFCDQIRPVFALFFCPFFFRFAFGLYLFISHWRDWFSGTDHFRPVFAHFSLIFLSFFGHFSANFLLFALYIFSRFVSGLILAAARHLLHAVSLWAQREPARQ
jgi:hypothetical protein